MITFVVATLAIVQAPVTLEPKITSAIVMKNGMVMLVREAELPAGGGTFRIEKIPSAYDGAFWYGTAASKVGDVKTSLTYTKKKLSRGVANLAELLKANVGKTVQLKVGTQDGEIAQSGVIEDASPSQLTLRTGDNLRFINVASIVEVNTSTLTNKEVTAEVDWPALSITFTAESPTRDKFQILTLESGAAWAGSYLIELGKDRAEVNGKAQLGLGKLAFENVNVKLLAGSPHLLLSRRYDLATGIGSLFDYLGNRQSIYRELSTNPIDPYERLGDVIRTAANAMAVAQQGYWMGGAMGGGGFGGLGGSGGFVPQGLDQLQYDPNDNTIIVRGNDFQAQGGAGTAGNANEDVFLYDMGKTSLLPGERLTRPLFNVTSAYELINVWTDIGVPSIKKQLRLKNDSNIPFTPGSCMVLRNGDLLAMTEMPHAAPTQSVDIALGNVIDLKVETETQLIDSRVVRLANSMFTIYKHRKTIVLINPRDEDVVFEVRTEINGKILDNGGAKVTSVDNYFNRTEYHRQLLVWKVTVPARSVKELRAEFESRN